MTERRNIENLFSSLKIQDIPGPVFYQSPWTLRFELGTGKIWNNKRMVRKAYFIGAMERLAALWSLGSWDRLLWSFLPGEEEPPLQKVISLLDGLEPAEQWQDTCQDEEGEVPRENVLWAISPEGRPPRKLLAKIIRCDFGGIAQLASGVFWIDTRRGLLLHPYDDRGADLAALCREDLLPWYNTCKGWLLTYDRARMEKMMGEGKNF